MPAAPTIIPEISRDWNQRRSTSPPIGRSGPGIAWVIGMPTGARVPIRPGEAREIGMVEGGEVIIRRAGPDDAAVLADLGARIFRATFAADNDPDDMDAYLLGAFGPDRQLAEITEPGASTLLAVLDGLIGFAQLRAGPPPGCVPTPDPVEIRRFYVAPAWHGRGVAARLMHAALAEVAARGAGSAWLGVWEHNPRAIAFYRKFGFVDVGAQEFRLGRDVQTDRIMALTLPAPP